MTWVRQSRNGLSWKRDLLRKSIAGIEIENAGRVAGKSIHPFLQPTKEGSGIFAGRRNVIATSFRTGRISREFGNTSEAIHHGADGIAAIGDR